MWFWCYCGSYLFQKYSSLQTWSLNNICKVAIPGQILARQCSWRAVKLFHRLHSPHHQPGRFNNSTTRSTAAKWKTTANFGITDISFIFLFFDSKPGSCQPICGISSAKAALVCSFRASGKKRRRLGCRSIMRTRGCAVQTKGITLIQINALKHKIEDWVA